MTKKYLLILTLIIISLSSIVIFYPRGCQVVNGDIHIYKNQCLPDNYLPELVVLSARASYLNTTKQIDIRAKKLLEKLIIDAENDGKCLTVIGAYRSYEYQEKLYNEIEDKLIVAKPGQSEHQTGLAVDFAACPMKDGKRDDSIARYELVKPFQKLSEYQWLLDNAYKYSFEQSFTTANQLITGYANEPWHWKFIIVEK